MEDRSEVYNAVWLKGVIAFVIALPVGTFVEYWGHRLMHARMLLGKRHAMHHRIGLGQGWFREFRAYLVPAPFLITAAFVESPASGIGFAVGSAVYAAFAAYSHQIQHECPELAFWLPQPTHYLHHKHSMWRYNFGITVDFWDRVFRTYLAVEWRPSRRPFDNPYANSSKSIGFMTACENLGSRDDCPVSFAGQVVVEVQEIAEEHGWH